LSYEDGHREGYIWMVDVRLNRDCKGWWHADDSGVYFWRIECPDGFGARGELTTPLSGNGKGSGADTHGRPVTFVFRSE